jgi:hypothetical protein
VLMLALKVLACPGSHTHAQTHTDSRHYGISSLTHHTAVPCTPYVCCLLCKPILHTTQ